jgi:ABC-type nitrate/sulfonate/bicarbonate transport system ATPase subunit
MISLDRISFKYPGRAPIFDEFCWEIEEGSAWTVLGPSGCGKTTLLYLLAGLLFPQSGRVSIDGVNITRPRPQTGLILQDYGLLPWATVKENASLGLRIRQYYGPDGKHAPSAEVLSPEVINNWLAKLGIADVSDQFPGQLSGGQRQRTAIARTLALNPDLLLMDEPFSSLDAMTRANLQELTLALWRENKFTMAAVTHAIEEAALMGEKILVLGKAPIQAGFVFENPGFGSEGFRESKAFSDICRQIREKVEDF